MLIALLLLLSCVTQAFAILPASITLAPENGSGSRATFTATFNGNASDFYLGYIFFLPSPSLVNFSGSDACIVEWNRLGGAFDGKGGIRLIDNAGTNWLGPLVGYPVGSAHVLSNSRCSVDVSTAVSEVGASAAITLTVSFTATLGRNLATFVQAFDTRGLTTEIRQMGVWINPEVFAFGTELDFPYSIVTVNGNSLQFTIRTARRPGSIAPEIDFLISDKIVGGTPCQIVFFPQANRVNLVNDSGSALVSPLGSDPSGPALQNSRCAIAAGGWARLTLTFPGDIGPSDSLFATVNFNTTTFSGPKTLYVNAFNDQGQVTHWRPIAVVTIQ